MGRGGVGGRAIAAGAAIVVDRLVGEPPVRPHPVSLFGRTMRAVERRVYADRSGPGVAYAATGLAIGVAVGALMRSTTVATYLAVAGRALDEAAAGVDLALTAGDLDRARTLLPALVGRDPSELDEKEIARAVVESVAENTVDAVVSPALWAVIAGAPGALGYRAVNTMDAMVGYRSDAYRRFGTASARVDDAANVVPARLTAVLVSVARPRAAGDVWRTVHRDASAHPSPSGGVVEAAFAAALGVQLGGTSRYGERIEDRPLLGTGRPVEPADIAAARRLARDVDLLLAALLVVKGAALAALGRHRRVLGAVQARSGHEPNPESDGERP
jgi:adenosylcobinamide-phosphate synthase